MLTEKEVFMVPVVEHAVRMRSIYIEPRVIDGSFVR